jgi:hypothetical protein
MTFSTKVSKSAISLPVLTPNLLLPVSIGPDHPLAPEFERKMRENLSASTTT